MTAQGETLLERTKRGDWSHLDFWRVRPLEDGGFAFGPVHLVPRFNANAAAFVTALAPTPQHGMLWSDAEALGFLGAQIGKEASRLARHVNEPFRRAVRERAGAGDYHLDIAPLVRVCPQHGKGTPMCFSINSGAAWVSAFIAAVLGGITQEEVDRLNAIVEPERDVYEGCFTVADLARPPDLRIWIELRDVHIAWKGFSRTHPLFRAIELLHHVNNDEPFDWGHVQCSFGWGWISRRRRERTA